MESGKKIRELRMWKGLTQEELAEQKSSADELENVCKSILQSAGEAGCSGRNRTEGLHP